MSSCNFQPPAPIPAEKLRAGGDSLNFVFPNTPSRCTWKVGSTEKPPHEFEQHERREKILPNVLHTIGNTPLIKLNRIPKSLGIKCEVLVKCEFFNPAGSVKDRIALRMILDAEKRGLLKPGDTIIEPTSGNTGLGLAMAAAVKGYKCIIVMPMKMSKEKVDTLKALGAEIIRTPTAAAWDSPESLISVAQQICKETPNSIILDQYRNAFNPIAHYEHTAQEIIDECDGKLDAIICGAGTGGTISGIGRKIKEVCPSCKVIAADPLGSSLSLPAELNETDVTFYEVEGIGYDFIPTVLDRSVVDLWCKTNDKDSLTMARRLIREEGLLCGGSSGSALSAAMEVAKTMAEDQRVVVLLPDGMRNYMTKFIDESWMNIRDFVESKDRKELWWSGLPVSVLKLKVPPLIKASVSCRDTVRSMKEQNVDYTFVEKEGEIIGLLTTAKILTLMANSESGIDENIEKAIVPIRKISSNTKLQKVSVILEKEDFVLVDMEIPDQRKWMYATPSDILDYVSSNYPKQG